jgi:hypothetical protein
MRLVKTFAAIVTLFIVAPASAQVVYSYSGNDFTTSFAPYTAAMSVDGSFEVAVALPPGATTDVSGSLVDFSFFDGVEARSLADSTICQFAVTTDGAGQIVAWDIWLREAGGADPQHSLETRSASDLAGFASPNAACGGAALNPFASVTGFPGSWTGSGGPTAVEVPTASDLGLMLLVAALALAALLHLRR